MAGVILAVVGVVVLIVAVVALRDPRSGGSQNADQSVAVSSTPSTSTSRSTPAPSPSATKSGSTSAPPLSLGSSDSTAPDPAAVKSVPLVVLNNTTVSGLARSAASRFENGGWTVTSFSNYTNNIISTCAYYDPSVSGAKAAAEALQAQYPTIRRVVPKFDGLPSGPIVVVLTPDYQSD